MRSQKSNPFPRASKKRVLLEQKRLTIFVLFCLHTACGLFRVSTLRHSITGTLGKLIVYQGQYIRQKNETSDSFLSPLVYLELPVNEIAVVLVFSFSASKLG